MSNEEAMDKAFGTLSNLIHKDYSAGSDGFTIYKTDIGKYMAKAKYDALKPLRKMPKGVSIKF
jgi:hypothetical protein